MKLYYEDEFGFIGGGFEVTAYYEGDYVGHIEMDDDLQPLRALLHVNNDMYESCKAREALVNSIHLLQVEPQYRNKGVAKKLLARFVFTADDLGIDLLVLKCCPTGDIGLGTDQLMRLYQRSGFRQIGVDADGSPYMAREGKIR